MSEIVDRLEEEARIYQINGATLAAKHIREALARIVELESALEPFAGLTDDEADRLFGQGWRRQTGPLTSEGFSIDPSAFKNARATLTPNTPPRHER